MIFVLLTTIDYWGILRIDHVNAENTLRVDPNRLILSGTSQLLSREIEDRLL
jgi:hypothetical protein